MSRYSYWNGQTEVVVGYNTNDHCFFAYVFKHPTERQREEDPTVEPRLQESIPRCSIDECLQMIDIYADQRNLKGLYKALSHDEIQARTPKKTNKEGGG